MNQKTLLGVALSLAMLAPMAAQAQIFNDVHADQQTPQATRYQYTDEFSTFKGSTLPTKNPITVDAHSTSPHMLMNLRNNTDEEQHFKVPEIGFDYTVPPRSERTIHLDTSSLSRDVRYTFENDRGQQTSAGSLQRFQPSGS